METGIEPKAAIVLTSAIPAVSALDDLHATMDAFDELRVGPRKRFDEFEAAIDREFARQCYILTGLTLLNIAAIVVSGILDGRP